MKCEWLHLQCEVLMMIAHNSLVRQKEGVQAEEEEEAVGQKN